MAIKLIATCPDEAKTVLAKELAELGATGIEEGFRAVSFHADEELYYRCHVQLSTASNLFRVVRECAAKNQETLRSQARRVAWPEIFAINKTYRVDAVAGDRGPDAMSANQISKMVREAIEDVFNHKLQKKPLVDLKNPQVIVNAFVYKGRACISMQTSGKALHKRGYRLDGHPAPLKETMAATLLRLAGYDGSTPFLDPMCGSGTIAIEAAMLACRKASNIHRKKGEFGFEELLDFDKQLWRQVQDDLRAQKLEAPPCPVFASDLEDKYVAMARNNALRARVERYISFNQASFFDLEKPAPGGIIVTNLPYGERLQSAGDLQAFYLAIGDALKQKFSGWKACLFVNDESPWKHIGLKPTKKYALLNGSIKTRLLIFDLYDGSRKKKPTEANAD